MATPKKKLKVAKKAVKPKAKRVKLVNPLRVALDAHAHRLHDLERLMEERRANTVKAFQNTGHNIADMENFKDVVHHSTTTKFNWPDRLRLLVGRPVTIRSKIYTAEPVTVLRSEAECTVHRIRKPRIGPGEIIDEAFTHGG